MLQAMGYKYTGKTTMVLEGPIDPDRVSNVSRDSLMAFVECQVMITFQIFVCFVLKTTIFFPSTFNHNFSILP